MKAWFFLIKLVFLGVLFALLPLQSAWAAPFQPESKVMKVDEIRPGMKGEARTVLKGQAVVSFPVTVVSVLPKKGIPRHLVLIRAEGPLIEKTGGIAAGMSGSPVFIEGRLVGAIGYGWDFSDHRLGLVTPIEDMASVFEWTDLNPPFYRPPLPVPKVISDDAASQDIVSGDVPEDVFSEDEENGAESDDILPEPSVSSEEPAGANTPMITFFSDGLSRRSLASLSDTLGSRVLSLGGSAGKNVPPVEKVKGMKPGEAVGVLLAWGDVTLGATGTLTTTGKDGRFLAFAHPFTSKGAVAYPLTRAWVHEVIPSVESPFKLGTPLSIIGTVTQDRPQAIGGRLNVYPPSFDFTVNFDDVDNKKKTTERFHVALAPFLLSKIAPDALTGMLDDLWGQMGAGTGKLKLTVSGPDLPGGWNRNNLFFSEKDLTKEILKELKEIAEVIALNPFTEIAPLGFTLDVEMTSKPRILLIEDVKLDKKKIAPGEKVQVTVSMRPFRKDAFSRTFELTVPKDAAGSATVVVRGGGINEPEQNSILEGKTAIKDFQTLLKELAVRETNNQVVVEIVSAEAPKMKTAKLPFTKETEDDEDEEEEPKLLSQITEKKLKEGSLRLFMTNYYVDGLQRREISVKTNSGKE